MAKQHLEITSQFSRQLTPVEDRKCGSCYACCVWLGIEELRKHTGQTCKHLSGGSNPDHRCSIYPDRPKACSGYLCLWLAGFGPDEMRPYDSGILISAYPSQRDDNKVTITINVFDKKKAEPYINDTLGMIVGKDEIDEVRLIYIKEKSARVFKDGKIWECKLLPPEGFESLMFVAFDPPIGTYYTREIEGE